MYKKKMNKLKHFLYIKLYIVIKFEFSVFIIKLWIFLSH
jgi:hypothetical protein